jgi:hypothetical protein
MPFSLGNSTAAQLVLISPSLSKTLTVDSSIDLLYQLALTFTITSATLCKKSAQLPYFVVLSGLDNL